MRQRFSGVVLALALAAGCRPQEKPPTPVRTERSEEMKIGDLEITAALNRAGTPYSSQEDILLQVRLENQAQAQTLAPMLASMPSTWTLKNASTGKEEIKRWTPTPRPGLPRFDDDPEVNLEPGQVWSPALPLQDYLGFFPKGKYSVKFKLESSKYPFATGWMDFEVNAQQVGASSATPSMPGLARYLHHAWLDLGSTPPRIIFRRPSTGKERPLPHRTQAIGEAGPASEPHASMAPPGAEPPTAFVGWILGDSVKLARVKGNDSVSNHAQKLPFKPDSVRGPFLTYSEKPGGASPQLEGMVLETGKAGTNLHAFRMAPPAPVAWLPPFALPPGRILAFRLLPVTPTLNAALWMREASGVLKVECLPWEDGKPLGVPVSSGDLKAPAAGYQAFATALVDGVIRWSAAFLSPGAGGKPGRIEVLSHGFNAAQTKTAAGAPKSRTYAAQPGPARVTLAVDSDGTTWVLQRDVHGAWVQSPDWEDAIAVESPKGSSLESLFFRRGNLPRVLLLDPDSGFQIKAIEFPTGQSEDLDQDVEVNEGSAP